MKSTLIGMPLALLLVATAGAQASPVSNLGATNSEASSGSVSRTVASSGPVKVGQKAPTFAGWTTEGQMLGLRSLLEPAGGKATGEQKGPLIVSFFATWCEPCKEGLPVIAEVERETGARVVLVAFGERSEVVQPWLAQQGLQLTTIVDPYRKISERWGVDKALPRTFVLRADGKVRTIFTVEGADFRDALRAAVKAAK